MARSFIPILLLAILGVAAGFFKAATPHQEAAVPAPTTLSAFDEGLDNANIASDMNISPAASVASAWDEPGRRIAPFLAFNGQNQQFVAYSSVGL
eukprot:CAMPEP_0181083376 /NCGR_PEP_ID=MMETSP1071-20121207/4123_1 /TAXON_ID=35127 /ORGANISM="Thalassiosira sp., Strain NH16" /LENGTH=94 /DNA_ID=CAMNT_0023165027 /DNA_START=85 /DNA_END=370 /DNA_ORIENTATION=+